MSFTIIIIKNYSVVLECTGDDGVYAGGDGWADGWAYTKVGGCANITGDGGPITNDALSVNAELCIPLTTKTGCTGKAGGVLGNTGGVFIHTRVSLLIYFGVVFIVKPNGFKLLVLSMLTLELLVV